MGNYTFITDKFSQIQREIGMTNFTGFFEMAINGLPSITEQTKLSMDVYHAHTALPEIRKAAKSLSNSAHYIINKIDDPAQISIGSFPTLQAAVALLFIDEDFLEANFLEAIQLYKKADYRLILFRNYSNDPGNETLLGRYFPAPTQLVNLGVFADQNDDLMLQIDQGLNTGHYTFAKLLDISIGQSVIPLVEALREIIATESKIAATQKQLTVQDNIILRKEEPGSLSNEINTSTRQILQKNILDTEKGFKAKYEEKNKANIGEFYLQSDIFASMLSFEDLQQQDIAEKSEKIETQIKESKLSDYKKSIAANLSSEMQQDLAFLDSSATETIAKVNRILQDRGLKAIDPNNLINPSIEIEKTISANNYFQRGYIGEVTKKRCDGILCCFTGLHWYYHGCRRTIWSLDHAFIGSDR